MSVSRQNSARLQLGTKNYALLGAAVLALVLGYTLLARGSVQLAPVLLVLGYCVLFPLGLLLNNGQETGE